jgi:hypothetical protein
MARLAVLLLHSTAGAAWRPDNGGFGFKATLRQVDANKGYTDAQLVSRALHRGKGRLAALQSLAMSPPADAITAARILVRASEGEYLMDMAVGTPPRHYSSIMDTGSDLVWTQCAPCLLCVD